MIIFGYKPDGSSCLFDLDEGEILPLGWSDDVKTIQDEAKRRGEVITEACGASIRAPVRVESMPDANPVDVKPIKRRRGRPPRPPAEGNGIGAGRAEFIDIDNSLDPISY